MDLDAISMGELGLFEELARSRSVHAAARLLKRTPSHVSKSLSRLERKLGVPLFHRSVKGLHITREGRNLMTAVERLHEPLLSLSSLALETHSAEPRQLVTLGAAAFLNRSLGAALASQLFQQARDTRLRFLDINPDRLVAVGLAGAFDVALHVGRMNWPSSWLEENVTPLEWGLIAHAHHSLGSTAGQEAVLRYPFVCPTYWNVDGYCAGNDHCPLPLALRRRGSEVSTVETAIEIVRRTEEIAFVPLIAAQALLARKEIKRIRVKGWKTVTLPLMLSVRSAAVKRSLHATLLRVLREEIRSLNRIPSNK